MLASYMGNGCYMVARDRLVAIVGDVKLVICPMCQTENEVVPRQVTAALVVAYSSSVSGEAFSGIG